MFFFKENQKMKKIIPGFVCLLLITSCGLEMPESITVKGNPGLFFPLGSPFAGMKEGERLEDLISSDNMKKMMNDNVEKAGVNDDLKIYEVDGELAEALGIDPKVRTYLAQYPLAKMPLDLEEYADDAMNAVNEEKQFTIPSVPFVPADSFIYLTEDGPVENNTNKPFIKIPLIDMAKLVKWVEAETNGIFGLEITYSPELAQYLELKSLPGLGFDWMKGIPTDDNGNPNPSTTPTKLRYYAYDESDPTKTPTKNMFYPRFQRDDNGVQTAPSDLDIDGNLLVYARVSGPFQEQIHTPSMIFEWKKAGIDTVTGTDKGSFTGDYPITNNLSEFLGKGVSFKTIEGYMYMSGFHGDGYMDIGIYGANDVPLYTPPNSPLRLHDVAPLVFPKDKKIFTKDDKDKFFNQSLDDTLKLEKLLNDANSEKLKVAIKLTGMEIERDEFENPEKKYIQFDLLVLVPLDLQVLNDAPDVTTDRDIKIKEEYVMLDLGDALNKTKTGEDGKPSDLLGRKEGDENNALKSIAYVAISLKFSDSDINIIDTRKLAVLVTTTNKDGTKLSKLLEFKNNASLRFTGAALNEIPFNPEFTVLLKKDTPDQPGTINPSPGSFKILNPTDPRFDFKLYVEAKAALEYTLDL
jgi:hypothetical protein